MRRIPRLLSKAFGKFIPEPKLFSLSTPAFLPFYHLVSNKRLPHILNYNFRDTREFENELDFFLKYFNPVSLEYIYQKKGFSDKVFHVSFDDGLRECAEVVSPILLKKGIPATFFVNTAFVDNKALFHKYKASLILSELKKNTHIKAAQYLFENGFQGNRLLTIPANMENILDETAEMLGLDFKDFLKNEKPYLSTKQILELKEKGFTIGAHSKDHQEFWKITEEEQFTQIKESMHWIEKNIQPEIRAFSFPFTDDGISKELFRKVKNEDICDLTFGTAGLKYDEIENHFQRYPMEINGNFRQNLKAEYVYFWLRKIIGKETVTH